MPRSARYEIERRLVSAKKSVENAEGLLKRARAARDRAIIDAITRGLMTRTEVAKALGMSQASITRVEGLPSSWSKSTPNEETAA